MPISPALTTLAASAALRLRLGTQTLVLALGIALASLTALPARADSYSEASQLFKSGQHAEALKRVNRHLAAKPKDAQGRFLKGIILTGMNKQKDAIEVFQKLTEDFPDLPEPYNNLAVIYAQQKQYDKARQALEQAIRTHPAYATAHENLGDIYSRLASQAYGKALQIDSSNASAQTKLAMINDLVGGERAGAGKPAAPATPAVPAKAPAATPVTPPTPVVIASAGTKPATAPAARPESKPAEAKPVPPPVAVPVATPVAPPTPAPAPKPEPVKAADANSEITAAVDSWLAAWSKKDVNTYLAHYARDFRTPDGQSRKEWEAERTQRVGKPGKIDVSRDKLNIKVEGSDKATVRFRQGYKSASFNSTSGKTLVLVKRDGKWLIQQERVGG
jgi:Flp pilus assembly protein TadD